MTDSMDTFQVTLGAAEAYESRFVPALFAEWAPLLVEAAGIGPGQAVLDVACGTGVVTRAAADAVGAEGTVIGVDLNPAMLTVAARVRPDLDWRGGDAGALPFADATFDVVVCQAALMFLPDPTGALREMARVVRHGGTVAVQVWAGLEDQPAYGPFVDVAVRHAGPEARTLLGTYWALGDLDGLRDRFREAGLRVTSSTTRVGTARFASLDEVVGIEVESTPLADRIDGATYQRILDDSREALGRFRTATGTAELPIAGHLIVATT